MSIDLEAFEHETAVSLVHGLWATQLTYVLCKLGVPDRMGDGWHTAAALSEACGAHAHTLYRVLRACTVLNLTEEEHGRFRLTSLGKYLRTDVPRSVAGVAMMAGDEGYWNICGGLLKAVRSGTHAADAGPRVYTDIGASVASASAFGEAMHARLVGTVDGLVASLIEHYPFIREGCVVDVGGGTGGLLGTLLVACPRAHGVLLDMPATLPAARERLTGMCVIDRCELHGGSFFETVPPDGDLYILRSVAHDWNDADAQRILSACRVAMRPGTPLIVIEVVIEPDKPDGKLDDLEVMLSLGGLERTEAQWSTLLWRSGLQLCRLLPTAGACKLIEVRHGTGAQHDPVEAALPC